MDGRSAENRKKKKGGSTWVAIVVMLAAALIGNIEKDGATGFIVILAVMIAVLAVIAVIVAVRKASAASGAGRSGRTDPAARRAAVELKPFSIFTRDAKLEENLFSDRRAQTTFDYGEVNKAFSHDQQRRLQQLDSFLKNGIIEKEEYQILRNRYLNPRDPS